MDSVKQCRANEEFQLCSFEDKENEDRNYTSRDCSAYTQQYTNKKS